MADTLRLAIVADIHHGEDHYTKKGSAALPLMGEFARFVRDARRWCATRIAGPATRATDAGSARSA